VGSSSAESIEDCLNICSRLHGNDSQLVFLVDPNQEGLIVVVEDASAIGPVSIQTNSLKIFISFLEQEMIVNKLLSLSFGQVV